MKQFTTNAHKGVREFYFFLLGGTRTEKGWESLLYNIWALLLYFYFSYIFELISPCILKLNMGLFMWFFNWTIMLFTVGEGKLYQNNVSSFKRRFSLILELTNMQSFKPMQTFTSYLFPNTKFCWGWVIVIHNFPHVLTTNIASNPEVRMRKILKQ